MVHINIGTEQKQLWILATPLIVHIFYFLTIDHRLEYSTTSENSIQNMRVLFSQILCAFRYILLEHFSFRNSCIKKTDQIIQVSLDFIRMVGFDYPVLATRFWLLKTRFLPDFSSFFQIFRLEIRAKSNFISFQGSSSGFRSSF